MHNRLRPGVLASLLALSTGIAFAAPVSPELEGPVCHAAAPGSTGSDVHVLTLDDLEPARAAYLQRKLAAARQADSLIALAPGTQEPSSNLTARLALAADRRAAEFARLQATEPEMLPNGLYRLDVGTALLTPLVATVSPAGDLTIEHSASSATVPTEELP